MRQKIIGITKNYFYVNKTSRRDKLLTTIKYECACHYIYQKNEEIRSFEPSERYNISNLSNSPTRTSRQLWRFYDRSPNLYFFIAIHVQDFHPCTSEFKSRSVTAHPHLRNEKLITGPENNSQPTFSNHFALSTMHSSKQQETNRLTLNTVRSNP